LRFQEKAKSTNGRDTAINQVITTYLEPNTLQEGFIFQLVKSKIIQSNLKSIRDYFINLSDAISNGYTPVVKPVLGIYEKYVLPDIKKKQKFSNKRQKNWPLESKHIRNGIIG
jgi:hypothetical protein